MEDFKRELKNELIKFELFTEIGLRAFFNTVLWLKKSIEKYSKNGDNEIVKTNATRVMTTYQLEIEAKVILCDLEAEKLNILENYQNKLMTSIFTFITMVSAEQKEGEVVTADEMLIGFLLIEHHADNLCNFLQGLKEKSRNRMNQIINRGPIENQATETPERGRSSTTSQFDCIAPSANDEAGSEHNASNGSSREPEQSSSEMSLRFENLSMIENTTPVRNINNHCSQDLPASSVRTSVSNFSKVMYEPQDLIKFSIGNVPWKLACQRHENNFVVIVVCEWNEPNHSCIAFIKVRILSHFDESYFLEEDVTLQWDDQQKNCYFQFKMLDLTTSTNGYIENDTILIKLDHSIIETIGIPTPGAYHLSPEYELVVGNMTHTFPIVSIMRENDILQSESVIIGGYPWRLAMNPEGVYIFCNHAATFLFWSCKAKIEFRVINGSTKKHGVFENCRENVCSGTKWIQRSKVEIGKRDERTQTLFA